MNIFIDTRQLSLDFDFISKDQVENVIDFIVKEITLNYAKKLEQQAKNELKQTRSRYIQSIKVIDEGRMKGAILLDYSKDPLVRMLEEGASPFDIKKGFEKSKKRHLKKDGGWYLTIPFRESTPGAIGESDVFSNVLPQEVYEIAKNKPQEKKSSGIVSSQGLTLQDLRNTKYSIPDKREFIPATASSEAFKEYVHKNPIYQGVVKKKDSVTGQNIYMSFRRVSDLSDKDSWIHSGITAYKLMDKALTSLESTLENDLSLITDRALNKFGVI